MDTNGIFPSTMGDLQVTSGDVDSLVQVVSQAENSSFQELFPSSQVPLECCTCMMLYWISLKSESSKLHQASKLEFCVVGVFFSSMIVGFWQVSCETLDDCDGWTGNHILCRLYLEYQVNFSKSTITFASFVTLCFKNQLQLSLTRQIFSTNRAACGFFMFFQWPGQLHFSVHDCSDGLHFGSVRRS